MSDDRTPSDCECETVLFLIGIGALVAAGTVLAAFASPDRIPAMGWTMATCGFAFLLVASLVVVWISLKGAKRRADEIVKEMTAEEREGGEGSKKVPKPRLIDRYNDLGVPVWPFVFQGYLVAALAAAIALISLIGLLAHWPPFAEAREAKPASTFKPTPVTQTKG